MRLSFRIWRNPRFLLLNLAVVLVVTTVSAIGARAWRAAKTKPVPAPSSPARPVQSGEVGAELITCTPRGLEPAQITRPAGKFLLTINNISELRNLTLRLVNGSGQTLREKELTAGKLNWRELLDLQSGSYTITEANHPDWVCHLTITN